MQADQYYVGAVIALEKKIDSMIELWHQTCNQSLMFDKQGKAQPLLLFVGF